MGLSNIFIAVVIFFIDAEKSGGIRVMIGEEMALRFAYLKNIMNAESSGYQVLDIATGRTLGHVVRN